jgi:hypothetical protein
MLMRKFVVVPFGGVKMAELILKLRRIISNLLLIKGMLKVNVATASVFEMGQEFHRI